MKKETYICLECGARSHEDHCINCDSDLDSLNQVIALIYGDLLEGGDK